MMTSHQNTKRDGAPTTPLAANNTKGNVLSKEDKQLAILIIFVLSLASCHPCLSQQIATHLNVSIHVLRNIMLSMAVMIILALMIVSGGEDQKVLFDRDTRASKQHRS